MYKFVRANQNKSYKVFYAQNTYIIFFLPLENNISVRKNKRFAHLKDTK